MKNKIFKFVIGILILVIVAAGMIHSASTAKAAPAGPNAIIAWNTIAIRTIAPQPAAAAFIYGSYVQAAVYNAVVAIEGGYQPYHSNIPASPGASVDAAVATAAHNVLVKYFSAQQAALDSDYQTSLAAIPDSTAKTGGIQIGTQAASELITLRQGDGLNADIGFTMPAPGPGVWQLPAGANPVTPWLSKLKPFMLESTDQFRPAPPPDLTSSEWATEYNEVMAYGRNDSQVRTSEQTQIARFWSSVPFTQYNQSYQLVSSSRGLNAMQTARLMAMGNMVAADALVGCFDAKYHYLFWRPAFAIPQGDADGNPNTPGDPTFVPLLATPGHPEYPSAHGCATSAEAEMFKIGRAHV